MADTAYRISSTGSAEIIGAEPADYIQLLKPRVMSLVVFSGLAGLLVAPGTLHPILAVVAVLCIAVGAGAAGAINMWYDRDIDRIMERTMNRPLPAGRVKPNAALILGTILSVISISTMTIFVNIISGILLAATVLFYVFVYTVWLKRRTPQNIVIGGAAGALPPMIGWAAVTNDIAIGSLILFAIIFLWTPPHFWALSLYLTEDYEKAGVPMMPVVSGKVETKRLILLYSFILFPVTLAPYFIGLIGAYGLALISILGIIFIGHAFRVKISDEPHAPRSMFRYSIFYLFLVFVILIADHTFL